MKRYWLKISRTNEKYKCTDSEAQSISKRIKKKKCTRRHIMQKLQNTKGKETILKVFKE